MSADVASTVSRRCEADSADNNLMIASQELDVGRRNLWMGPA